MTVTTTLGFGLVTSAILAFGAAGFSLQFGVSNILNLAYGAVMSVCMYVAYVVNVTAELNIWMALAVAALAGALLSWLLNVALFSPLSRRGVSPWALIVVTFAASIIIDSVLQSIIGTNFAAYNQPTYRAVHVLGMVLSTLQLEIIGLAVVVMTALHVLLRYSRMGKQMRATAANPELARTSGIATSRVTGAAWLISGTLCGMAGVLVAVNYTTFSALTGETVLLVVVAAAVIGGIGQPYGAMLGALVVGMATEFAALVSPQLKDVIAFAILAATLLIRPNGLIPSPAVELGAQ